jgi:hypothetical protein
MTQPATFRRSLTAAALALIALISTPVHAQGAPPPKPALWLVQDADTTLYLFGTIHFMRPDLDWRTARVTEAMEASDALFLEVADPDDQAAVAPLIQQYGMSPDRPLSSLLNAEDLVRLESHYFGHFEILRKSNGIGGFLVRIAAILTLYSIRLRLHKLFFDAFVTK